MSSTDENQGNVARCCSAWRKMQLATRTVPRSTCGPIPSGAAATFINLVFGRTLRVAPRENESTDAVPSYLDSGIDGLSV